MDWSLKMGETGLEGYTPPEGSVAEGHLSTRVFDVFRKCWVPSLYFADASR